jgi:fumarate reductase flavoprotein subunit
LTILSRVEAEFSFSVDVAIVGAGACGLCAGLAAAQAGAEVLILERDETALGTTAMSTGLIPAAGSALQKAAGVEDSPEQFANDICAKTKFRTDANIALALANESAATIDWLVDEHEIPLSLVDSFLYPGHSALRMHGTPNRTGGELIGSLCAAAERAEIQILTEATVTDLFADDDGRILGLRCRRPDGSNEDLGCKAIILACCGFAGNSEMVREYMPEIAAGEFFGHLGNKGDAVKWGTALGAAVADMNAYQGHGGLAKGYGIPILWPAIVEGGIQVNQEGLRFSNEALGYSEQAVNVLQQSGAVAWTFFDEARHNLMLEFDDYRDAVSAGAIRSADTLQGICEQTKLPVDAMEKTLEEISALTEREATDEFGRSFNESSPLSAPYYAVKVTGALFHTQGGLVVDENGQVLRPDGSSLPNLFAGGGAARGISGPDASGYIAGNGLVTATTFGRLAGIAAAKLRRA